MAHGVLGQLLDRIIGQWARRVVEGVVLVRAARYSLALPSHRLLVQVRRGQDQRHAVGHVTVVRRVCAEDAAHI